MPNLRRIVSFVSVLALFAGLASAQVGGTGQSGFACGANVVVTPALRGEGFTEQTADITIACTGGNTLAPGSMVPLVNFTIWYNTVVTSRLLPTAGDPATNYVSEALLLIDEPGSGLAGYEPSLPQKLCTTPLTGCAAWVGAVPGPTLGTAVSSGSTPAPNVYQGVVSGNSVTFYGVPYLPTGVTSSRIFRMTNIRVNAQSLSGVSVPVQASISSGGALPITYSTLTVGYVGPSLTATASGAASLSQCSSQTKTSATTLTFSENFGSAFKTRVNAQTNTLYAGQIGNPVQNIPGAIYNSESNFVFPIPGSSPAQVAGLADFGTRLKATFNNIPVGAHVFVSTVNVNNNAFPVTAPSPVGGSVANANPTVPPYVYAGYAQLVSVGSSESVNDGANGGFSNIVVPNGPDNGPNNGNVPIAEVSLSNGTGAAVWEVVNTNPNTIESFKFSVYISYTASVATNSPLPGTATVNLSFAPTATSGVASSTLPVPRFANDSAAARNILNINICRTILLYPYITNQAGFDTGLTIANTSSDPFGTANQAGSCKLTWYGGTTAAPTTPPGPSDTGNIAAGTVWANTLQAIAPNFQGYMFAVCNFQYAHGFAFISDVGARNLAMGYLALVLTDPTTQDNGVRNSSPIGSGNVNKNGGGEQGAH